MKNKELNQIGSIDRFEAISDGYALLMAEVFNEMGQNYAEMEETVFNAIKENKKSKTIPILDIGIGDGETIIPFIRAGYTNLTGFDLNPLMLEQARKKLGESVKFVHGDALVLPFKTKQFPVIISGAAIHNIAKKDRKIFWQELLRMNPELFVNFDKIADSDPKKQKIFYEREINAINKIYREKHGLIEKADEWVRHCQCDQKEQLTTDEIKENLGNDYDIEILVDRGLYKTIMAKKK